MRKKIILTVLAVVPMALIGLAAKVYAFQPSSGVAFGYSSEDSGGTSYLGVDTRNVTTDRLSALSLKEEKGVEVTMVDQDAPAGKAGLKEHDVILSLNGNSVESVEQLRRMIREIPPGRVVTVGISRSGQAQSIKVQLADRRRAFGYGPSAKDFNFTVPTMPIPPMPEIDMPVSVVVVHSSMRSGLMVENLTPQLGEFFGAKTGGVLVRSVEKGSQADKAGFHAGDVVVKVNGQEVNDTGDFTHAIRGQKSGTVSVNIIRDKKEQTLSLTIPERKQSESMEESFEVPEIDAETRISLDNARDEIARIQPQLEKARREIERNRPAMEKAARELTEHNVEIQREMIQMQEDMQEQQLDLQQRQREMQEEMRFDLPSGRADI